MVVAASPSTKSAQLQVAGVSGLLTSLANCCHPLPGDDIVGFISRGKGAIIHRADCKNISRYRQRDRERLVNVGWTNMNQQRYLVPIIVTSKDRPGMMRDLAYVVSDMGVNMTAVNTRVTPSKELAVLTLTLEVESLEQMEQIILRLQRVKDVTRVERDLGRQPGSQE